MWPPTLFIKFQNYVKLILRASYQYFRRYCPNDVKHTCHSTIANNYSNKSRYFLFLATFTHEIVLARTIINKKQLIHDELTTYLYKY